MRIQLTELYRCTIQIPNNIHPYKSKFIINNNPVITRARSLMYLSQ